MGRSPKQLRDELRFLTDFGTLCDVMQQTAIAQLAREDAAASAAPQLTIFCRDACLPMLPAAAAGHQVFRRGRGPRAIVVWTSDEGMVGPLHALVVRKAMSLADTAVTWILVGHRANRLFGPAGRGARRMLCPRPEEAAATWWRLGEVLLEDLARGAIGEAVFVAPRYVSRSRQEPAVYPLLPLPAQALGSAARQHEIIVEPSLELVARHVALGWVAATCLEAQVSARRAEYAARILHMERARDELARHTKTARHQLFKTIHTRVDVMVRETCVVQRLAEVRRRAAAGAAG